MKKIVSVLLSVIIFFSILSVATYALSEDEIEDGYAFDSVIVMINEEYASSDGSYTPEFFDEELVASVSVIASSDENSREWFQIVLLMLKEPSKDNVKLLISNLKKNPAVESAEKNFIYSADSSESTPEYSFFIPHDMRYYADYSNVEQNTSETINMLYNPYYEVYKDELFSYSKAIIDSYMNEDVYEYCFNEFICPQIRNVSEGSYLYCTVFVTEPEFLDMYIGAEADYTKSVLLKYFDSEDILYTGSKVFGAIVRISSSDYESIKNAVDLMIIPAAFFQSLPDEEYTGIKKEYILGDVLTEDDFAETKVTSADARYILRLASGIEIPDEKDAKRIYFCSDVNLDNKITVADARLALRAAAGLDGIQTLSFSDMNYWKDSFEFKG